MPNQKELNKVDINVQFEESPTRINITSGEGIKTLFGKIRKYFSDLHSVAFSGSYEDLNNKPTIPEIPDISTKMDKDNPVGTGSLSIEGNGVYSGKVSVGTDITPTEDNDLTTKKYVDNNISAVNAKIGNLENLSTTDKTSIVNAINEIKASASGGGTTQMTVTVATLCDSSGSTITLTDDTNNYDLLFCTVTIYKTSKTLLGVKAIGEVIIPKTARLEVSGTTAKAYWFTTAVSMESCRVIGIKFIFS